MSTPFRKLLRVKTQRPPDKVDEMRTIYWYTGLLLVAHTSTSASLERQFEPDAYRRSQAGTRYHLNKWPKYRDGKPTPGAALVDKVNKNAPGSIYDINHVIWHVLRMKQEDLDDIESWLMLFSPQIQILAFEASDPYGPALRCRLKEANGTLRAQLMRQAGLDALAYLTLLLLDARKRNNHKLGNALVRNIYQMLLMLGALLRGRGIGEQLYIYYKEHFLFLDGDRALGINESSIDFIGKTIDLFSRSYKAAEAMKGRYSWNKQVRCMIRMLHGHYGFEIMLSMRPQFYPQRDHCTEDDDGWAYRSLLAPQADTD